VIVTWRAVGVLLAGLATWGLVLLSDVTWQVEEGDDAMLRLSWRAVGHRVEECRVPTEEELAALPAHMRRTEICEGRLAPFRLDVSLDGRTLVDRSVRAEGAREDRPAYVFEEYRVPAGPHRLDVRFRVDAAAAGVHPPARTLEADLDLAPRQVVLVTTDEATGELTLVRAGRASRTGE